MPKRSQEKNLQYELWPKAKWEWRQMYDMPEKEVHIFFGYTYVKDGHLLWSGYSNNRGVPTYYHRGYKRTLSARRIAWTMYRGPIEANMDVIAMCGNKKCISYKCIRKVNKDRGLGAMKIYD